MKAVRFIYFLPEVKGTGQFLERKFVLLYTKSLTEAENRV
jgi:hypothetical protein